MRVLYQISALLLVIGLAHFTDTNGEEAYTEYSAALDPQYQSDPVLELVSSGLDRSLLSVAASDDRLVTVGEKGIMLRSSNGVMWDSVTSLMKIGFYDIIWTGSIFLTLAHDNIFPWPGILISREGEEWMSAFEIPPASEGLYSVTFSGDKYTAVGYGGQVFSSRDALVWNVELESSVTLDRNLFSVIRAESLYVAVGEHWNVTRNKWQGAAAISKNGTVWDWIEIDGTSLLFDLAFHNGTLYAVGYTGTWGSSRAVIAQMDKSGLWSIEEFDNAEYFRAIKPYKYGLVAVGSGGAVMTSTDGNSWHRIESGTDQPLNDVAVFNGDLVIVGKAGTILRANYE